jgi:hypothetical protein
MTPTPNITPEAIKAIEAMIEAGLPMKHAVAKLGLSYNTFRKQLDRGAADIERGEETIFAELSRAVERGRAAKVGKWVGWLQAPNANGEIEGANIRFLLERTEPKDFGAKQTIDAKIEHTSAKEELEAIFARIRGAEGEKE